MRSFDYGSIEQELLNPNTMNLVSAIHEYKGKQELFIEAEPDILVAMLEIAKIQSTGASNRIEGIYTTDERLTQLVRDKATPRNRSEEEIAGYREVLSTIHESYEYIIPRPNIILQLHRDLYSFSKGVGGRYKNADNIIVLSEGKIAEQGSHSALLERNGVYPAMWADYQRSAKWNVGKEAAV